MKLSGLHERSTMSRRFLFLTDFELLKRSFSYLNSYLYHSYEIQLPINDLHKSESFSSIS